MFNYNNIILLVLLVLLFLLILRYYNKKNVFGGNFKYKLHLQNIIKQKDIDTYTKSIIRIPNFLTNEECKKLINMAKPNMSRSLVIGRSKRKESAVRTSTNTFLYKNNRLVNKINNKLENIVKISKENYERPQIARYKPKQFYKEHHDICTPLDSPFCKDDYNRGGYRVKTAIIYLTDTFEGGHTSFPLLDKKFKLSAGEIIIFDNIYDKNKYELSLHQGNPIKSGTKWILTIWIREKKFI